MPVAGVDVGAVATKVVVIEGDRVLSYAIMPSRLDGSDATPMCLNQALSRRSLSRSDIVYVVSTGYGRRNVDFADRAVTEITAQAKGARHLFPNARTIIDIGGQDSKVICLDEQGAVVDFTMNDRCAAGTGRFLEVMATTLGVDVAALGCISANSRTPAEVSSMCTVFAESEVISMLARGRSREDIIAGLHASIAKRIAAMAKQVGIRPDIVFTGGVAKNRGMKAALEEVLGFDMKAPPEPQITGALGASLIAWEQMNSSIRHNSAF